MEDLPRLTKKTSIESEEEKDYLELDEEIILPEEEKDPKNEIEEKDSTDEQLSYEKTTQTTYNQYFPVKEHLENRYFPENVLGFANLSTGEAFIKPTVYGPMRRVVKIHERLHLMYKHLNEVAARVMTNYLSGGPYIPTGISY